MTENGPVDIVGRLSMVFIRCQVYEASLSAKECLKFWSKSKRKSAASLIKGSPSLVLKKEKEKLAFTVGRKTYIKAPVQGPHELMNS